MSHDEYRKRLLDHLLARVLPAGNSLEHALVYWSHVAEAINNAALFPPPVVQGIDPDALRALPRGKIAWNDGSRVDDMLRDCVFWRDIQALIDVLPAKAESEPEPKYTPPCQAHRWVRYPICYSDRAGVFSRRICIVCHADEEAPPRPGLDDTGLITAPLSVSGQNAAAPPEPSAAPVHPVDALEQLAGQAGYALDPAVLARLRAVCDQGDPAKTMMAPEPVIVQCMRCEQTRQVPEGVRPPFHCLAWRHATWDEAGRKHVDERRRCLLCGDVWKPK